MIQGDSGAAGIRQRRDELQQCSERLCRELKRSKFSLEALKGPRKRELEIAIVLHGVGIILF